jgi:subtilisin family serine protease
MQFRVPSLALAAAAMFVAAGAAGAAPRTFTPGAIHFDRQFVDLLARPAGKRHPLADASGRLPLAVRLAPGDTARAHGWLPFGSGFATVRVPPAELAQFEADHPGVRYAIWPPLHILLDESAKLNRTNDYRAALAAAGSTVAGTGKGTIVGVIDTGIDGQHPDFIDASGHTRVAWLLDLSHVAVGLHPELEAEFGCNVSQQAPCAVLSADDIDRALAGNGGAAYIPRDIVGHGTHVASIAAGNDPNGRFIGGAPEAQLIVAAVAEGPDGLVTDANIATGARFIFEQADAMGMPAVANLSLGGDFGPHDGSTTLEQSLSEMVGAAHPGRAIVVAAGNSGTLYRGRSAAEVLGIHTELRVSPDGSARAPLLSPGASTDPNLSGTVLIWITYGANDHVAIGLTGPNGIVVAPTAVGQKGSYTSSSGSFTVAVLNGVEQDPEAALSANAHGAVVAWTGTWPSASEIALDLQGDGLAEAWVTTQLDNGVLEPELFEHALLQTTVNVPATHADLIAVGCTVNRTTWTDANQQPHDASGLLALGNNLEPDATCVFSSAGPNTAGAFKPEISAPGALVAAAMSRDAVPASGRASIFDAPPGECANAEPCLVVDAHHALLSGSSMSTPQVAGAVALLFERNASLTESDISRALQQGARRPAGSVFADYQLGSGALDVRGAVAALDSVAITGTGLPDPAQSWLSLSDGFAHPDLGDVVTGTVELRAGDGTAADAFDPSRLTLEVSDAATITAPLARVAAGMWRFAITGQPGAGQNVIALGVRFDGTAIGQAGKLSGLRSLPVGGDRWIAVQGAVAHGGCAMARGGTFGRRDAGDARVAIALLCLTMLTARRRSAHSRATHTASHRGRTAPTAADRRR